MDIRNEATDEQIATRNERADAEKRAAREGVQKHLERKELELELWGPMGPGADVRIVEVGTGAGLTTRHGVDRKGVLRTVQKASGGPSNT